MSRPSSTKVHSSVMADQPGEHGPSQTFTSSKKNEQSCASFSRMIATSDVGIHILRFLTRSDLNTFALVSKECRHVRNQPELDQTREASIVLKTDLFKVCPGVERKEQDAPGHRPIVDFVTKWIRDLNSKAQFTDLRIHISSSDLSYYDISLNLHTECPVLGHVHTLRVTTAPRKAGYEVREIVPFLCFLAPNVRRLILDYPPDRGFHGSNDSQLLQSNDFKKLEILQYSTTHEISQDDGKVYYLSDVDFIACRLENNQSLRELYLNNCSLMKYTKEHQRMERQRRNNPYPNYPFLGAVQDRLVRVSCKGVHALWTGIYIELEIDFWCVNKPISQDDLMHFVRNAPKLRWFESDLTCDNIRILQQERPEVVFVS